MHLVLEDLVDHEGRVLVVASVDTVPNGVQQHTELELAFLENAVVGLLADTGESTAPVIVHPPIVLVAGVSPVHELSGVLAVGAPVAVGVADHDVPLAVGGVSVHAHVVVVVDADKGVVVLLVEGDFTVVDVASVAAVIVVEHAVGNLGEGGCEWEGGADALVLVHVVHLLGFSALLVLGHAGGEGLGDGIELHVLGLLGVQASSVGLGGANSGFQAGFDVEQSHFKLVHLSLGGELHLHVEGFVEHGGGGSGVGLEDIGGSGHVGSIGKQFCTRQRVHKNAVRLSNISNFAATTVNIKFHADHARAQACMCAGVEAFFGGGHSPALVRVELARCGQRLPSVQWGITQDLAVFVRPGGGGNVLSRCWTPLLVSPMALIMVSSTPARLSRVASMPAASNNGA